MSVGFIQEAESWVQEELAKLRTTHALQLTTYEAALRKALSTTLIQTVARDATTAGAILSDVPLPGAQAAGKALETIGAGATAIQTEVDKAKTDLNLIAPAIATPETDAALVAAGLVKSPATSGYPPNGTDGLPQ